MNVGGRPAAGSPGGSGDGGIMLEGGEAIGGIKSARPMISSPRMVQLSNELIASRSTPQGLADSLLCRCSDDCVLLINLH